MSPRSAISYRDIGTSTALAPGLRDAIVDVMPTALALAGATGSPDHPFDGKNIWPTLSGLNGASHPVGITLRVVGATKSSRSPLRDRSTMPSCVIDLD